MRLMWTASHWADHRPRNRIVGGGEDLHAHLRCRAAEGNRGAQVPSGQGSEGLPFTNLRPSTWTLGQLHRSED